MGKGRKAPRRKRSQPGSGPPSAFHHVFGGQVLAQVGPVVLADWLVPSELERHLLADGKQVPSPIGGGLLLDTGATRTCITQRVAEDLGLIQTGIHEGYGAGGRHTNRVYFARLHIGIGDRNTGQRTDIHLEAPVQGIPDLERATGGLLVDGLPLPCIGLLGRDLLRFTRFNYDGLRGTLDLKFDMDALASALGSATTG